VPGPSDEAEPQRKKLKVIFSGVAAPVSPVQAPAISDADIFKELSYLLLPDSMTLVEISAYSIAMTFEDFDFSEYGPLEGH